MAQARIQSTHKLTCPAGELTAQIVREFLDPLDCEAKIDIRVQNADRPGEISTVSLSAEVDIQKGRIY